MSGLLESERARSLSSPSEKLPFRLRSEKLLAAPSCAYNLFLHLPIVEICLCKIKPYTVLLWPIFYFAAEAYLKFYI
jgi:hypothetical protein